MAEVTATLIANDKLICDSPMVQLSGQGSLNTYLRISVDDKASYNTVPFSFYGLCPDNQCNHGFCSFGRCVCYYRYRGENCDELLLAPIISSSSSTFDLAEGDSFSHQLEVSQGSTPIDWAIVSVPVPGLTIDTSTGLLSFENPPDRKSVV